MIKKRSAQNELYYFQGSSQATCGWNDKRTKIMLASFPLFVHLHVFISPLNLARKLLYNSLWIAY